MTERMIELERADAKREALEEAAMRLENYATNDVYAQALRLGAKLIRAMKNTILAKG